MGKLEEQVCTLKLAWRLKNLCVKWYKGDSVNGPAWITYVPDAAGDDYELSADTEANIRAKMLIYLIENQLIEM